MELDTALLAEERPGPRWLVTNMVTSIDGATAIEGGSTRLSDDDDRALFHALRSISDVVLVGAGTVRSENYRPIRPVSGVAEQREARGQRPAPLLVIVSGRLSLDPEARVFSEPQYRPMVIGSSLAARDTVEALKSVADVILLESMVGRSITDALPEGVVLCEGGPSLNACLFTDGVVDEIDWTVSPLVVAGGSKRMVDGPALPDHETFDLARTWRGDRSLFLRYVRS